MGIDLAAVGREGTDRFCHLNQEAFDLLVAVLQELGCDTTPLTGDRIDVVPGVAAAGPHVGRLLRVGGGPRATRS